MITFTATSRVSQLTRLLAFSVEIYQPPESRHVVVTAAFYSCRANSWSTGGQGHAQMFLGAASSTPQAVLGWTSHH